MPKERVRVTAKDPINQASSPYTLESNNNVKSANNVAEELNNMSEVSSHLTINGSKDSKPESAACSPTPQSVETRTNLIVNYLPQAMTQEDLRILFSSAGELETCKLIRDKNNGQSLGYAFVNYKRAEGAVKAINSYNGLRLQNKAIKVSFARPSCDMIKGSNLYISGLSRHFTTQALYQLFNPFGQIITCRVLCDPASGKSKGVGFIRYNLKSEAEDAIKHLNGYSPDGSSEPITVKFANQPTFSTSKALAAAAAAAHMSGRLALAPLALGPPPVGAIIVQPGLGPQGAVFSVIQPQQSQHNGVIGYCSPDGSVLPLTPQAPQDFTPQVSAGQTHPACWSLLVHNLPPDCQDSTLHSLVSRYVRVLSARVVREGEGCKARAVGVVRLSCYEDCLVAIGSLDGLFIDQGHALRVTFTRQSQTSMSAAPPVIGQAMPASTAAGLLYQPAAGLGSSAAGFSASALTGSNAAGLVYQTAVGLGSTAAGLDSSAAGPMSNTAASAGLGYVPVAAADHNIVYNNSNTAAANLYCHTAAGPIRLAADSMGAMLASNGGFVNIGHNIVGQNMGHGIVGQNMGHNIVGPYYAPLLSAQTVNGFY